MIKVLIVEDDPMVAEINKRYINSVDGFEVVGVAGDGAEAIAFCRKWPVDLAILDIFMPRMDGMQLLGEIRKRFPGIDVVFVTASKEMQHIDRGLKLGAVDYLIKPFEYERMKQTLENYQLRFEWMQENHEASQKELDAYLSKIKSPQARMPKGLHEKTLMLMREYLASKPSQGLTSEAIGLELHISKVTVRRYLDYLEEAGEVKKEMVYGSVGRPSYVYHKI